MPKQSEEVSSEEIAAAMERYPGIPFPLAVTKYRLDQQMEGNIRWHLAPGSAWGGVHLERIGFIVQQMAEAVYHQSRKSITVKLTATDFPDTYDHWEVAIVAVEGGAKGEVELNPLAGWPCCACDETIGKDDFECGVAMLDKLAKWSYPTWGNILTGTGGRALAVLCGKCAKAKKTTQYAVKKDGEKFIRVPIKVLEDINGRPC